jgi:diguanylate cyclase (GGDEF)-like protein
MQNTSIKLLIVDDDEDDTYLIVDALQQVSRTRYAITTAASPLKAMTELAKQSFDVIFSDYRLGALTGVDFIKSVRAAQIETPIILLTGISDHVVDNAALEAGSSDFLSKTGLTPDTLDRSIRYSLAHADRQRMLQSILKNTQTGIVVLDQEGQVSLSNSQFQSMARAAFGDDSSAAQELISVSMAAETKDLVVGSLVLEPHITSLPDGKSILALNDVTQRVGVLREREQAEERIRNIAMQDVLTGLPNRMAFDNKLDDCLREAQRQNSNVAVLLFDFNRFKDVNDLFGHAAGDYLLKNAAEALRGVLSHGEFCARLGGDEFVLIQTNSSSEAALDLAERVSKNLDLTLDWEGKSIEASVTVGVSIYPKQGRTRQELLRNADLAMYRGKSTKDSSICVFDANMDQFIRDRRALAHDLRHAIEDDELSLDLQMQFHMHTKALAGCEALLRWDSPSRGRVSPAIFIPIAEENGMIFDIDLWVLSRSCRLLAEHDWIPRLAINISAKAICQPQIVAEIRAGLLKYGVSPARLELEVTETALVQDLNRALHNLRQIKAMGISIAMDDFGTGYSSLSLLSSFPFDRIKIDGSFIQLTGSNDRANELFKAVVGLGTALRVPVLVEGVETEEQFHFARAAGCEEMQGFYAAKPIPQKQMKELEPKIDLAKLDVEQATKLSVAKMLLDERNAVAPAMKLAASL